ncbi:hypothetical protein OPV22_025462 [Ensete ventricosum]|uniref:Uncharacterized protein n=1 Tax=Ensete ventricosum TaxID=4639 RepID=A0AAV8Q3U9_ENSVE|nr:hypothetical protein OPV22_025462 [Ensete ventricosum]
MDNTTTNQGGTQGLLKSGAFNLLCFLLGSFRTYFPHFFFLVFLKTNSEMQPCQLDLSLLDHCGALQSQEIDAKNMEEFAAPNTY